MNEIVEIAVTAATVVALIILLRFVLRRGRVAATLDDDARRMILRSLTLLVILGGVLFVFASNNPTVRRQMTEGVVSYLPRAIAGSLMLVAAVILGRVVGVFVGQILRERSAILGARVGKLLTVTIIVVGTVLAADQFGVTTDLLLIIIGAILASVALAAALALGMGSLPIARQVAAGRHVDDRFSVGDWVEVGDVKGTIVSIGLASSRISDDETEWELPNAIFLSEPVRVVRGGS